MLLITIGRVAVLLAVIVLLSSCATTPSSPGEKPLTPPRYQVKRLNTAMTLDADWDKPCWRDVKPLQLSYHIINEPDPLPKVQAKLLYDDENIYIIFRAEDQYVTTKALELNGRVSGDSAVEFFFTPGPDISRGYIILEGNCGGTILLAHADTGWVDHQFMDASDAAKIGIAHSLPRQILHEIPEPTTWTIEYRIPLDMVAKYRPIDKPAPGVVWRANFYKAASDTSHPHYLCWSLITKKGGFHQPEFFGFLEFTK